MMIYIYGSGSGGGGGGGGVGGGATKRVLLNFGLGYYSS